MQHIESMLKFFVVGFLTIILGCGGGGSDGSDASSGTPPRIDSVMLYRLDNAGQVASDTFIIGDQLTFALQATDPDLDISQMVVAHYYPAEATSAYFPPVTLPLPSQSSESRLFPPPQPTAVNGPAGQWRADFYVIDAKGNESDTVSVPFEVIAKYWYLDESFPDTDGNPATVDGWLESVSGTASITQSAGVVFFNNTNTADACSLTLTADAGLQVPLYRKFVVAVDVEVPLTQQLQIALADWAMATINGAGANTIRLSTNQSAQTVTPTSYASSRAQQFVFLIDPMAASVRFFLYWQDTSTTTIKSRMEEIGTAQSFDKTAAPTALQFATTAGGTGTAKVQNVQIFIPWGVTIGDSIATGHEGFDPVPARGMLNAQSSIGYWVEEHSLSLYPDNGVAVMNQGVGAHKIHSDVVNRYQSMMIDWDPEWAFIYAGTNDCFNRIPEADVQKDLTTIVDAALAAGIKVVIYEIAPRNTFSDLSNDWKKRWNSWLTEFVSGRPNCYLVQQHDVLEDPANPDKLLPALTDDGVHPTVAGYHLLGDLTWAQVSGALE